MSAAATSPGCLAEQVKALRVKAGLKQRQLAREAGVSSDTAYEIEAGRQTDPKLSTVQALAGALTKALGRVVTVDELVGEPTAAAQS